MNECLKHYSLNLRPECLNEIRKACNRTALRFKLQTGTLDSPCWGLSGCADVLAINLGRSEPARKQAWGQDLGMV